MSEPGSESDALAEIRARLEAHEPRRRGASDGIRAATAIVIADEGSGPELLLIRRTRRDGDPWSGDMAFPGGRPEPGDRDLVGTARRETREEVGVELDEPAGRLDEIGSRIERIVVTPFVFTLGARPPLDPEPDEVAGTSWVPLDHLRSDEAADRYWLFGVLPFPALRYDDDLIWGLTHRTLQRLFDVIG